MSGARFRRRLARLERMARPRLLLLCILIGLAAGCARDGIKDEFEERMVAAQYDVAGRMVLVLPFRDPAFDYFESQEGYDLSLFIGATFVTQKITDVCFGQTLPAGVKTMYSENAGDPPAAWKKIGKSLGCDLVLVGQITSPITIAMKEDGTAKQASVTLSAQLCDMARNGEVVWQLKDRTILFPEGWEYDVDDPAVSFSAQKIKNQLLQTAGEMIAMSFERHLEPQRR